MVLARQPFLIQENVMILGPAMHIIVLIPFESKLVLIPFESKLVLIPFESKFFVHYIGPISLFVFGGYKQRLRPCLSKFGAELKMHNDLVPLSRSNRDFSFLFFSFFFLGGGEGPHDS